MADTAQFIPPSTSSTTTAATPSELSPELAQTLALLSTHRSVLGYILLAHAHHGTGVSIIRHSGVVFDGEGGRTYAGVIARIVDSVRQGMDEVGEEDDVKFMRIRTRRHEIMISPDDKYLLAVLHDPSG